MIVQPTVTATTVAAPVASAPFVSGPVVTAIVTCMTDQERPFVAEGLRSVMRQTMPCAIRLYVRDDNDWIDELLARLAPGGQLPRGPWSLEVRRVPRMNSATVRNLGVEEAETTYVAFLDSDDIWLPRKIERQVAAAERLGVPFVGADHVMITECGRRFAFGAAKFLPMTSSWLVARHYMRRHPFNESIFRREDKDWWHRRHHDAPRYRLPEFLIAYRVRPSSKSAQGVRTTRKVQLARLSTRPGLRWAILGASWLHHRLNRRNYYACHPNAASGAVWEGITYHALDPLPGLTGELVLRPQKP
ncbi:MAG: glycosyltransferase family 2 protein [Kiloniellales bacterium]